MATMPLLPARPVSPFLSYYEKRPLEQDEHQERKRKGSGGVLQQLPLLNKSNNQTDHDKLNTTITTTSTTTRPATAPLRLPSGRRRLPYRLFIPRWKIVPDEVLPTKKEKKRAVKWKELNYLYAYMRRQVRMTSIASVIM